MRAFTALADPTRRKIVELLAEGELTAGEVAERFTSARPTISRHLRVLLAGGVVGVRRDAQRRVYALQPRAFAEIDAWLERYRALWNVRLDALERELATPRKELP